MKIGVLAVQGAFIEHRKMLSRLNTESFEIRKKSDLKNSFDALILPGGESTVMIKLLNELDIYSKIKIMIDSGLPVFGTCAGLILLAKNISGFKSMDISVKRNAYGRQLGSFNITENMQDIGMVPMTFIRAPYIESAGNNVKILASVDGKIVAARQDNQLVTAFHPELCDDLSVHNYFLRMIRQSHG